MYVQKKKTLKKKKKREVENPCSQGMLGEPNEMQHIKCVDWCSAWHKVCFWLMIT